MKIIILGYMGAGKSTIGKNLANNLGLNFIDLDDFIIQKESLSIKDIFNTKGELYFRKVERKYLSEIMQSPNDFILSVGGGTPCYGDNLNLINENENSRSIYLKGSIPFLAIRLFNEKEQRPLIAHLKDMDQLTEFLGKHLFERNQFYNKADQTIVIDNKSISEITEEIKATLI
ncbi:MAG: shikimate kinase [Bacteroidetes bacterium MedPE-SWsnd-G2]|nr:MAG: shikimate kinase [Bacteroidetes bacterium MedPE-SWsnd-G2]